MDLDMRKCHHRVYMKYMYNYHIYIKPFMLKVLSVIFLIMSISILTIEILSFFDYPQKEIFTKIVNMNTNEFNKFLLVNIVCFVPLTYAMACA